LAGNQGSSQYCLNSPWIKTTKGDVHAELGYVSSSPPTGQYSAEYIVSAGSGSLSSFSSSRNWYLNNYSQPSIRPTYNDLFGKIGSRAVSLPSGKLPTASGIYLVNSEFTIDNTTIPTGLVDVQNLGAVVFINGELTINKDYTLHPSSGIVFVVSDEMEVADSVNNIAGFFLVDESINLSSHHGTSQAITITGSLVSGEGYSLSRELPGNQNQSTPAVVINLSPSYLFNQSLISYISGEVKYSWQEVAP
jgi:hypothetical protein